VTDRFGRILEGDGDLDLLVGRVCGCPLRFGKMFEGQFKNSYRKIQILQNLPPGGGLAFPKGMFGCADGLMRIMCLGNYRIKLQNKQKANEPFFRFATMVIFDDNAKNDIVFELL